MATLVFVGFFLLVGLAIVLAAMRSGSRGPILDPARKSSRRLLAVLTGAAVVLFAVAIPLAVGLSAADDDAQAGAVKLTAAQTEGRQLFNENCRQCHTLAASNAVSMVGPDLDELRPPKALVVDAIEKGRARGRGQMPAQLLTGQDAQDVADYVARIAGR